MEVMALGRRVREMSRMPREAACCARKRKSIDCAFSELRAWMRGGLGFGGLRVGEGEGGLPFLRVGWVNSGFLVWRM